MYGSVVVFASGTASWKDTPGYVVHQKHHPSRNINSRSGGSGLSCLNQISDIFSRFVLKISSVQCELNLFFFFPSPQIILTDYQTV